MKKQVTFVMLLILGLLNITVSAFELKVESWPEGSGSVSGGGSYEEGARVRLNTSPNTGFRFLGWYDGSERVAQDRSFTYNMPVRDVTLTARYEFRPDSPGDPSMPDTTARYSFKAAVWPEGAGSVNVSAGKYPHGSRLNLSVSANTGFVFVGWYDGEEEVSSSRNCSYTMPRRDVELTARFDFSPGSPGDPAAPKARYPLTILKEPEGGGSVSPASGSRYAEGEKVSLSASLNSGFVFDGWVDSFGSVVSTSRNHTIVMPGAPTVLTARFRFSPGGPGDPQPSTPNRSIVYGSRVSAYPGGVAVFSVNLENAGQVSGIEFDMMLPEGIVFDMENAVPDGRADMHTLTVEPSGDKGCWHLSLRGEECFKGGNGPLIRIPVSVPGDVGPETAFVVSLRDAVVYSENGSPESVGVRDGQVKVSRQPDVLPDSPDFKVMSVTAESAEVMPGDAVTVGWTVANDGSLDAIGGWSETIYLADEKGKRVMLGTVFHDGAGLAVGQKVSRSATLTVPRLPGLSGRLNPVVTLMPYLASDEVIQFQADNTAAGEGFPITLGKRLILTLPEVITEGKDVTLRGQLARTGSWDESETFTLSSDGADPRISIPENVIILRDESAAWFPITVATNGKADPASAFGMTAVGNGYGSVSAAAPVIDSQLPAIQVVLEPDEATEGEMATLTASIPYALAEDLNVALSSAPADRLSLPSSLVIPAGKTEADVNIEVIDNDAVDGHHDIAILASASGFENGSEYLYVIDNDMPELQMQLSPVEVNENAGPVAVRGEVTRTTNLDKRVTLMLSADRDGQVLFPTERIVLERGVSSAEFTVGVLDNDRVEGDRDVEITASVFVSSCSCTAAGGLAGSVSRSIRILDNDRPSLALVSSKSVVAEGDRGGVEVTLSRNADLDKALSVDLSCDTPGALELPKSIVIRKGAASAIFKVSAPVNDVVDDDRTVVVSAKADGYASSSLWMMVTDRTLPDARITGISVDRKEVVAGGEVDVTLTLASTGVAPLPAQTCVAIYADGVVAGRVWLQQPLGPGVVKEFVRRIALPSHAGKCDIYAVANPDKVFNEISFSDNRSANVGIVLTSPFKAGVEVSASRISKGETVKVKGRLDSSSPEGQEVEVYMVNDGLRVAQTAVASADGSFEVSFTPYMTQSGHFAVGACCPGERLSDEMTSFEIIDLRRTDSGFVTREGTTGVPSEISFGLSNPCGIPMTGLTVRALNVPDGVEVGLKSPSMLGAGEKGMVALEVTGRRVSPGRDWERFTVAVASEEGAALEVPVYWYCRNAGGKVSGSVAYIEADLPQDKTVEYPVTVSNIGAGDTGAIEVVLPAWMKCAGPTRLPSLSPGEETVVTLLLKPTSEMALNHTVSGQLAVNCENGDGTVIRYKVMPVSDQPASLSVEACDEYTYNTKEAPRVQGAKVSVVNPGNGLIVAEGVTDETGCFLAELPAGYYRVAVSAEKHDSWSGTVFLNPGKTNTVTANISFNPITISYNVVPTEVEDEYLIETEARFEVNVPAPVVRIVAPKRIDGDSMEVGDATIINVQMVNEGLMTAFETSLLLEKDNPEWRFEPLDHTEPFDLAPRQTVNIPVRITRIADLAANKSRGMMRGPAEDMYQSYRGCMTHIEETYKIICGDTLKKNPPAERMAMKMCATSASVAALMSAFGDMMGGVGGPGGPMMPGGGGGGTVNSSSTKTQPVSYSRKFNICDPCDAGKAEDLIDNFVKATGGPVGVYWDALDNSVRASQDNKDPSQAVADDASDKLSSLPKDAMLGEFGPIVDLGGSVANLARPCADDQKPDSIDSKRKVLSIEKTDRYFNETDPHFNHSWQEAFYYEAKLFYEGWNALEAFYTILMGDPIWLFDPSEDKVAFMEYVKSLPEGTSVPDDILIGLKPESVTLEQAREYADRVSGVKDVAVMYRDELNDAIATFSRVEKSAVDAGYESGADRFFKAYAAYENEFDKLRNHAVCASVGLRFSQTMTMTREAFRGTLEVFNGHDDVPMRDVRLNLTVTDPDGMVATSHEFQINPESLTGFKGNLDLMAGWELNAGEHGVAEIIFIPTRYAAPDGPLVWDFGGSLTYIDPFTGLEVTRKLQPVGVTVNPTPVLDLTYFLQRDVYSDDPLTPDVVEQSEGAEFALVISNSGVGDARNVRLVTRQPQIVDNEKGILLETAFTSSQLNGSDRHMSLGGSMASEFGDIPAGSSSYAQWWFESSMAGHFTEYDVKATHVSSYGNPDLSMLGDVGIHELIRGITDPSPSGGLSRRLFLANDIVDADDLPDMVYFSDASREEPLGKAILSSEMIDRFTCRLNVQPMSPGWVYGNMDDPTGGRMRLVSIVRMSDGKAIPADNCWQTYMTLRDGNKPVHEYRLHVAVNTDRAESYRLVFESRPSGVLEVSEISGVPSDREGPVDPVRTVDVSFSKEVDQDGFTSDALRLTRAGERVDVSGVGIKRVSPVDYRLALGSATDLEGYYVLTVDASAIRDSEGFDGRDGRSAAWLQKGEPVGSVVSPVDGGCDFSISPVPVRGDMTVSGCFNRIVRLEVYDAAGTLLGRWTSLDSGSPGDGSRRSVHVKVRDIPSGVMIVRAVTDSGVIHSRRVLFVAD